MNRKLIHAISVVSKANPGAPVLLADLRQHLPGMSKSSFDKAILYLQQSGEYFLTRHFYPGQATEAEKEMMIPDGAGNHYFAINSREIVVTAEKESVIKSKRGRPSVPMHLRRERVAGRFRLPAWMLLWLKDQKDAGRVIEAALIAQYGLKSPEGPLMKEMELTVEEKNI